MFKIFPANNYRDVSLFLILPNYFRNHHARFETDRSILTKTSVWKETGTYYIYTLVYRVIKIWNIRPTEVKFFWKSVRLNTTLEQKKLCHQYLQIMKNVYFTRWVKLFLNSCNKIVRNKANRQKYYFSKKGKFFLASYHTQTNKISLENTLVIDTKH